MPHCEHIPLQVQALERVKCTSVIGKAVRKVSQKCKKKKKKKKKKVHVSILK